MIGSQHIHAANVQSHALGCTHGSAAFFRGDLDQLRTAAAMQVRTEIVRGTGSFHCGDDLAANDQRANIRAARFLDEFLHEDVHIGSAKRFDNRLCAAHGFGKHHADALRPFQQLDHDGWSFDRLDDFFRLLGIVRIGSQRQTQAVLCEYLHTAELVAAAADGDAFVQGPASTHFELPQYG